MASSSSVLAISSPVAVFNSAAWPSWICNMPALYTLTSCAYSASNSQFGTPATENSPVASEVSTLVGLATKLVSIATSSRLGSLTASMSVDTPKNPPTIKATPVTLPITHFRRFEDCASWPIVSSKPIDPMPKSSSDWLLDDASSSGTGDCSEDATSLLLSKSSSTPSNNSTPSIDVIGASNWSAKSSFCNGGSNATSWFESKKSSMSVVI